MRILDSADAARSETVSRLIAAVRETGRSNRGNLCPHDGDIISRVLTSMPPRDLPQKGCNTLAVRSGPHPADRLQEPGVAELPAGGVHRLGDPVGVEVQTISRPQADRPLLIGVVGEADRGP